MHIFLNATTCYAYHLTKKIVKLNNTTWFAYYLTENFVKLNTKTSSIFDLTEKLWNRMFQLQLHLIWRRISWNWILKFHLYLIWRKKLILTWFPFDHSVKKWKNYCHPRKISSNQLFSIFFSKTVTFTKFLSKKCERQWISVLNFYSVHIVLRKFEDYSGASVSREIIFLDSRSSKNCHLWRFKYSEFC